MALPLLETPLLQAPRKQLEGFVKLSKSISMHNPPAANGKHNNSHQLDSPDLILFLAWMGAHPKHIAKYVSGYEKLYPSAVIILITNTLPDMFWSTQAQAENLEPAVQAIEAYLKACGDVEPRILLHLFSNGGANQACQLALAFGRKTQQRLPLRAMILDSSPGTGSIRGGSRAAIYSLPPKGPARILGSITIYLLIILYAIFHQILRKEDAITSLRRGLNEPSIFDPTVPRCYIYSKSDDLVAWEDVETHAKQAEQRGWKVKKVCFDDTPHAGHIVKYEKAYWRTVEEMWQRGSGLSSDEDEGKDATIQADSQPKVFGENGLY